MPRRWVDLLTRCAVKQFEDAVALSKRRDLEEQQRNQVTQKGMSAGERWMGGRTECRNESGAQGRRANTFELLFVIHIRNVANGEPTVDELDGPWATALARIDECDDVIGEAVRLHIDFRKVTVAVVLHQHLQFVDLRPDYCPSSISLGIPGGGPRPSCLVGLPCEIVGLQPTV